MLLTFGAQEQDGIFITEDYLLENIAPPRQQTLSKNLNSIKSFADEIIIDLSKKSYITKNKTGVLHCADVRLSFVQNGIKRYKSTKTRQM